MKNKNSFFKQNPWKARFIIAFSSIIILLGTVRLILPQAIIYSATSWLEERGINSTIEDIKIGLFDGTISLINARGNVDEKSLFNIGLIDIHWHWAPLSEKSFVVTKIALDKLAVDIQQYPDEIIVGGVHIPLHTSESAVESEDSNNSIANPWTASLNEILITDLNVCYLQSTNAYDDTTDASTAIDYCVDMNEVSWIGNIAYSIEQNNLTTTGDFTLNGLGITDNKLNRQLVNISSHTLENVVMTDLDNIHIKKLKMAEFSSLQRSDNKTDSTLAFFSLVLQNIAYTKNSISIKSIALDGLSSTVSKNKNGKWEHDKWLSKKVENTDAKPADTKEPLRIDIKTINIKTDKEILFIDNSTDPEMKIGLNELGFNIDSLNTNTPEADNDFSFTGKTINHSTIDIDGTIRPFADKISINAEGKLKGFDLRTATPQTKKAIGHIIKSGQLDADMKILAVDGQLDSSIDLSLHQFHIKPMSKEDSAKFDKELGMPLNQTLTLLRDKDDGIHLTIPITGDVSNPDFNPMHAIAKATTKAATATLITFYTPYGLIYAGGNVLFDLATAMNFDPIRFDAGSADLLGDGKKQLDKLTALLTEKPKIHLTLCGMTNKDDAHALYPNLKTPPEKNKSDLVTDLSKDQISGLNQLATDRQIASKNYFIEVAKVSHDRLILCEPEHQTNEDAISGVDVNI